MPAFFEQLRRAYDAQLARCIICSGNIYDLFPQEGDGETRFVPLEQLLLHRLRSASYATRREPGNFIVLGLKSHGIEFAAPEDRAELLALADRLEAGPPSEGKGLGLALRQILVAARPEDGRPLAFVALTCIGQLLRTVARVRRLGMPVRPLAAILDHADALFPAADVSRLSPLDRDVFKYAFDLLRDEEIWPDAETAGERPDFVLMLTPTVADLNPRLLTLPKTVHVEIGLPDEAARRQFVEGRLARMPVELRYPVEPVEAFVRDARGLTLRTLDDLITRASRERAPLGRDEVVEQVNDQIHRRLGGIVRIVYPEHSMADVIGFSKLKRRLTQLAQRLDDPELAPAGAVWVGPNGSGKTFISEAFAADSGRTVVVLAGIRSEWYGKTDAFTEMFRETIAAFGRIIVVVDEAHVAFGSIHSPGVHETERRLTGNIIQIMDDEALRSKVFWALMTTRPDLLDPDIVRRGRCSLFIPVFDPEGEDAEEFLRWMLARFEKRGIVLSPEEVELVRQRSKLFSAGDYREFIADFIAERRLDAAMSVEQFLASWTPSAVALAEQRELQIHLAALRCDWDELLPARLRDLTREELQRRLAQY